MFSKAQKGELARSRSRNVFIHSYLFFEVFSFFFFNIYVSDAVFACVHQSWEIMCVLTGTAADLPDFCLQSKFFISSIKPKKKWGRNCSKCPRRAFLKVTSESDTFGTPLSQSRASCSFFSSSSSLWLSLSLLFLFSTVYHHYFLSSTYLTFSVQPTVHVFPLRSFLIFASSASFSLLPPHHLLLPPNPRCFFFISPFPLWSDLTSLFFLHPSALFFSHWSSIFFFLILLLVQHQGNFMTPVACNYIPLVYGTKGYLTFFCTN